LAGKQTFAETKERKNMSNSESGYLAILMLVGNAASVLGSGYYAWQWIEPEVFLGLSNS